MFMGSLIRTAALRGYGDLVRELGGDPGSFLARFGIPAGAEQQADGFVAVDFPVSRASTFSDPLP
jgi:hypothetical protein